MIYLILECQHFYICNRRSWRYGLPRNKPYGSWNTNFGANYTIEGVSSGNLASTDATQYVATVEVTDGVLDVAVNKGSKSYGGYINGMDIIPVKSDITAEIAYSGNTVTVTAEGASKAILIHASYKNGTLVNIDVIPVVFTDGKTTVKKTDIISGDKLMLWDSAFGMISLCEAYIK